MQRFVRSNPLSISEGGSGETFYPEVANKVWLVRLDFLAGDPEASAVEASLLCSLISTSPHLRRHHLRADEVWPMPNIFVRRGNVRQVFQVYLSTSRAFALVMERAS